MLLERDLGNRQVCEGGSLCLLPRTGAHGRSGAGVSAEVPQMVESRRIYHYPSHQLESVDPSARKLLFPNGTEAGFPSRNAVRQSGIRFDSNQYRC